MEKSLLAPDLRPGVYHEISRFPDHVESCQRQEVPVLVSSSMRRTKCKAELSLKHESLVPQVVSGRHLDGFSGELGGLGQADRDASHVRAEFL